jgi:alkanesulfonate monooxygenase SsuD/methylene tetrahydromethanopterin reductase-like flavin-dependent oxidoreductase (luciferase family)
VKIGVLLPTTEPDQGPIARYREIRASALEAERAGFDAIWIVDHLLYEWEGQPRHGVWEAWTLLAGLAEATNRVEIGTLVLCTAFRNPALLAKMVDAAEEVSEGRLILGLGAGWHEPEFTAFNYPFDHRVSRFEDALRIIAPLVRTGAVDYRGQYEHALNCESLPRGPRPAGPPILIGGAGPRMLRLTAEFADAWNTCWLGRASELPERVVRMHGACAEVGRDPATLEITAGQIVTFSDLTRETAPDGEDERFTFAGPEELAAAWRAFAIQGVGHLIVRPMPFNGDCLTCVSAALQVYRDGIGR